MADSLWIVPCGTCGKIVTRHLARKSGRISRHICEDMKGIQVQDGMVTPTEEIEALPRETVICKGNSYQLEDATYWHAVISPMLLHNAFNKEGLLPTISLINQIPGEEDTVSMQSLKGKTDEKEILWERVRKEVNPNLPTRNGALFVAEDEATIKKMNDTWFANQGRKIVRAKVIAGSTMLRADASWLEAKQDEWGISARRYWQGEMSATPMPELLVHGLLYFPDWKSPPFGIFGGIFNT